MPRKVYRVNPTKLDREMREQKISATLLGNAAGHSDHSYIARMRRGEPRAQSATKQTAEAISKVLGLPLDYLFEQIDPRTGRPMPVDSQTPDTAVA